MQVVGGIEFHEISPRHDTNVHGVRAKLVRRAKMEGGVVYFILELSEADILVRLPLSTPKTPLSTSPRFQ